MSKKNPSSDLITSQEVANMLGLGINAVRNLSIQGVIPQPAVNILSGKRMILRWSRNEILDYIKKNAGLWAKRQQEKQQEMTNE
jgi:hypothetical protein